MFETLTLYFQYPFVINALIVGILIALCSSLLGVTLVLKRFSLIGDGLAHVAFGALSVATILNFANKMLVTLPITIIFAVLILRGGQKIKGDAIIAMISVGSLAFGYLIMNLFANSSSNLAGDVCATLFGSTSILTLTSEEVFFSVLLSILMILAFAAFYNKIFAVTIDENFAKAVGLDVELYNLLISVVVAVIIVLSMNLVGSLLISAFIIFPALSAMKIFKTFRAVTVFSAIFSVICALIGLISSILAGTPVGSTIVAVDTLGFLICWLIGGDFSCKNLFSRP